MKQLHRIILFLFLVAVVIDARAQDQKKVNWKKVRVLVYTKNGKGYVHDNIPHAVTAIRKLASDKGFQVDVTDDPAVFTEDNLKRYSFLLFPSTNNDVFDTEAQRIAFRRYMQAGGGFVGLHSVIGTERNWRWFKMMLGGSFAWHPRFQSLRIRILDKDHPSVAGMPGVWVKEDECYFMKELYPGIHVVMAHELTSLKPDEKELERMKSVTSNFGDFYPAAWHHDFDGGTIWITTLGHDKKDYEDRTFINHIFQGMNFVASRPGKVDFSRSYATERDTPIP